MKRVNRLVVCVFNPAAAIRSLRSRGARTTDRGVYSVLIASIGLTDAALRAGR